MSSLLHLLYQNVADKMALTHVIAAVVEPDTQSQLLVNVVSWWHCLVEGAQMLLGLLQCVNPLRSIYFHSTYPVISQCPVYKTIARKLDFSIQRLSRAVSRMEFHTRAFACRAHRLSRVGFDMQDFLWRLSHAGFPTPGFFMQGFLHRLSCVDSPVQAFTQRLWHAGFHTWGFPSRLSQEGLSHVGLYM